MLLVMMFWVMNFQSTWSANDLHATNPGSYVQVVHSDYDAVNNQTYFVLARFEIMPQGNEYVHFMQPRPLVGKVTDTQKMLDTVEVDSSITKVK